MAAAAKVVQRIRNSFFFAAPPELGAPQALPPTKAPKQGNADAADLLPYQREVFHAYNTPIIQYFVAAVILFNFFAIVIEKEIDPYTTREHQRYADTWMYIDDVCNIIFILELTANIYGSFWRSFVGNAWNYLDTVVVAIGITSLARVDLGSLSQLKLLRAFRIVRLFKRVKSLNKILVALLRSIPGVINAFLVMLIFMCIFAILAVDFFRDFGATGEYQTIQTFGAADAQWGEGEGMTFTEGNGVYTPIEMWSNHSSMTPRGFHYGQEYYGTFFRSLYTLFQVLTGESWSEAVVRPLLFGREAGATSAFGVGLFFTFYILATQVVLQNVVVAVLLDKFVEDSDKNTQENEAAGGAGDSASMQQLDEAVLAQATALEQETASATVNGQPLARTAAPGSGTEQPPSARSKLAANEAKVALLEADYAKIIKEQAVIKAQLHLILDRLGGAPSRPASRPNTPPRQPGDHGLSA